MGSASQARAGSESFVSTGGVLAAAAACTGSSSFLAAFVTSSVDADAATARDTDTSNARVVRGLQLLAQFR